MTNINLGQFYMKSTQKKKIIQPFGLRILLEISDNNVPGHRTINFVLSIDPNGLELNILQVIYITWPEDGH